MKELNIIDDDKEDEPEDQVIQQNMKNQTEDKIMEDPFSIKSNNKKKKKNRDFDEFSETSFRLNNDIEDIVFKPSTHFDDID